MDAQFVFVPENWVAKLILNKLLSMCISLANELRAIQQHEQVKDEESFEEAIDRKLRENLTIQRVNAIAGDTKRLHEVYSTQLEQTDARVIK